MPGKETSGCRRRFRSREIGVVCQTLTFFTAPTTVNSGREFMIFDESGLDGQDARVDDWLASIEERASRARALNERLAGLSASSVSADRLVQVTVDASGRLTKLELDDGVRGHSGRWVAEHIMRTLAHAQQQVADQVKGVVADTVGLDTPQGQAVVAAMRAKAPHTGRSRDRRDGRGGHSGHRSGGR